MNEYLLLIALTIWIGFGALVFLVFRDIYRGIKEAQRRKD